jgi:hypothetical protein
MRITIDSDDKGNVKIDTGEKGYDKPRLFEGTADIPVIDAGAAPIQDIERLRNAGTAADVGGVQAHLSPQDREAQLPLNPLRAGAAAAYQNPANLRKRAVDSEGVRLAPAVQDPSSTTMDGGSAKIPAEKKSSGSPTYERQSAKGKRDKKR